MISSYGAVAFTLARRGSAMFGRRLRQPKAAVWVGSGATLAAILAHGHYQINLEKHEATTGEPQQPVNPASPW